MEDCQITSGIQEYQTFVFQTVLLELRYESGYLYDRRCWRLKQSSP